ncbi:hypothetical protein D3C73_1117100 [compost metagenome]
MVIGQLFHLRLGDFRQPLFAEAERHRPQAGQPLDIALAGIVGDIDTVAALDHEAAGFFIFPKIDHRMHLIGHVAGFDRVRHNRHVLLHKRALLPRLIDIRRAQAVISASFARPGMASIRLFV